MFRRKIDQLRLEETSWCLGRGGHIDIYPPYTQSLTYTHIYTMTLVPFPHLWHLQPWWRRRKQAKSEEFLTVICVRSFIQPTFIKNRLVTSGIALVLETDRQDMASVYGELSKKQESRQESRWSQHHKIQAKRAVSTDTPGAQDEGA